MTAPFTKAQKRRAYRAAVQAVLTAFYQTPEPASRKLVAAWWKRLSDSSSFRTGLFMHAEPMNTAADLLQAEPIPITSGIRHSYHEILRNSHELSVQPKQKHLAGEAAHFAQPEFASIGAQKQLKIG